MRVQFRWMIRRDLPQVLAIEQQSYDRPWSEDELLTAMRQRICISMVAERGEEILGFMLYNLLDGELRLINFAVGPAFRRQGIGSLMVDKLILKLSQQKRERIRLEVREGNLPAQLFFRACGFRAIETIHGRYTDTDEDAYVMQHKLGGQVMQPVAGRFHITNRIANLKDDKSP